LTNSGIDKNRFQNVVFLIKSFVAYLIPDVPGRIMAQMRRQNYLSKQAFYRHEFEANYVRTHAPHGQQAKGKKAGGGGDEQDDYLA